MTMNETNDQGWTPLDRALAARIRASVDGAKLPPDFSARLVPALAARRRARRARRFAAAAIAVAFAAAALLAGSAGRVRGDGTDAPRLLVDGPRSGSPGTEIAAGWTLAGICRTLRRRRRDEDNPDPDSPRNPPHAP